MAQRWELQQRLLCLTRGQLHNTSRIIYYNNMTYIYIYIYVYMYNLFLSLFAYLFMYLFTHVFLYYCIFCIYVFMYYLFIQNILSWGLGLRA